MGKRAWTVGAFGWVLAACSAEKEASFDCTEVRVESREQLAALAAAHCKKVSTLFIGKDVETTDGLDDIERVDSLEVDGQVRSLEGLSGLKSAARITLQARLDSLKGLDNLVSVDSFEIQLANLHDLSGLGSLERAHLTMRGNGLESLEGLSGAFNHADNSLSVSFDRVSSLSGLRNLRTIGKLELEHLGITSLVGLENLTAVSEAFALRDNDSLETSIGVESLREVGTLTIVRNHALKDLSGFAGVTRTRELTLGSGWSLGTLGPLMEWPPGTVTDRLSIRGTRVPQCEVEQFRATQAPLDPSCACEGNVRDGCSPPVPPAEGVDAGPPY